MSDRPEYEQLARMRTAAPKHTATYLPVVHEDEAAGDVAAAYQYFRDQTGRQDVPGIVKCFSGNPALVRQMINISSSLLFCEGALTRRHKELIAAWISKLNACPYCFDSHGFFFLVHGGSEGALQKLSAGEIDSAEITAAERALLRYAEQVNGASYRLDREAARVLEAEGWRPEQIAETVHMAAFMGFCNRIANAFGLPSQGFLELAKAQPGLGDEGNG
ncbi:MAG TPA: peroxidase-related enzyme [Terracidiphilus sp.]|nr:peroxidase-related enzyme [Terracidiphilus sp.]